jgi:hypothetical protein
MSIWEAITGKYKDLPEVIPSELEMMRAMNLPLVRQRFDNKIALDLMHKGLVKLTRGGYGLTGKGRSVLAVKSRQPSKSERF